MKEISADIIRFHEGGKFTKLRKNIAITYLFDFVEIFENKVMNNTHASIIKTRFISSNQIEFIEKIAKAIYRSEIKDPLIYLEKYFDLLMMLECSIIYSKWKEEAKRDLLEFYERFGYLTSKQIDFVQVLFDKAIPPDIKEALANNQIKNITFEDRTFEALRTSMPEEIMLKLIDKILNHLSLTGKKKTYEHIRNESDIIKGDKLSMIEGKLRTLFLKEEIKESQKIISQIEEKIHKKFLSLSEMRAALSFVVNSSK